MANATVLTINDLVPNAFKVRPAGDVFDTGGTPVTVYGKVDNKRSGHVVLEVQNGGTAALVVTALAGDHPPAFRSGLGNVMGTIPAGSVSLFGPFETARFVQSDGTFGITLTPTGTIAGTVRAYHVPNV